MGNILKKIFLGQDSKFNEIINEFRKNNKNAVPELIRAKIMHEDTLFNARTNIFLVLNGLGAVAMGLNNINDNGRLLICVLGALLNSHWFFCSRQSLKVLSGLTKSLRIITPDDPIDKLVQRLLGKNQWARPTTIICVYLPLNISIAWILGLFFFIS